MRVNNQSCLSDFEYSLAWALVGQEQRWVALAGSLGELRRFEFCSLVNQKSHFKHSTAIFTHNMVSVFLFVKTYLEDTPSVVSPCSERVS